jgi:hypothetical protein
LIRVFKLVAGYRGIRVATFFNEYFEVTEDAIAEHGAFNVSIINDVPLFIDPFLLFNSKKTDYQDLHHDILRYMRFLRDAVLEGRVTNDLEAAWFMFPEVRQNWLGFSLRGNGGTGLGRDFASALRKNLASLFSDFGNETISRSSHIEKVCLISEGVGKDNISDFTTNLVKDWLCRYTEDFAKKRVPSQFRRRVAVKKAIFNYSTEAWESAEYDLPWLETHNDFVLLTPKDMLTRDENWINRPDLIRGFDSIAPSIEDNALRGQVSNYFEKMLFSDLGSRRQPSQRERDLAAARTLMAFPQLLDYYIRIKENSGDQAVDISAQKVFETRQIFESQVKLLQAELAKNTRFYDLNGSSYIEAHDRLKYLKDIIENKGGFRIFYHNGRPIQRESDVQILFRFVWFGTPSDVSREVNDGRGPVDFKISRGAKDKTLVEFKLAKNTGLERNLEKQLPVYQSASDAKRGIKAIVFFSEPERRKVEAVLKRLGISGHQDVVLIDARMDNKPSGSKA